MDSKKYIGMDVHKESISIAVRNAAGKIVMECVIETKANLILQFVDGLRGELHVTFEEGTSAAWLYDLLKPHVTKLVVCDPRKNRSMREGNQNDKIDARRLAVTKDLGRVMSRVKAIYRSWAIPCTGKQVYAPLMRMVTNSIRRLGITSSLTFLLSRISVPPCSPERKSPKSSPKPRSKSVSYSFCSRLVVFEQANCSVSK